MVQYHWYVLRLWSTLASRWFLSWLSSLALTIYVDLEFEQTEWVDRVSSVGNVIVVIVNKSSSAGSAVPFSFTSSTLGVVLVIDNVWLPSFLRANALSIQLILTATCASTGLELLVILCPHYELNVHQLLEYSHEASQMTIRYCQKYFLYNPL